VHNATLLASLLMGLGSLPSQAETSLPATPQAWSSAEGEARLIISRDRNAPNACDVELRLGEQWITRVPLGESVTLHVPAGEQSLYLSIEPGGYCADITLGNSQSIILEPGTTRYFQLVYNDDALFLAPQPQ